jgi:hypothetical protein
LAEPLRSQMHDHAILTARAGSLSSNTSNTKTSAKRITWPRCCKSAATPLVHVFSAMEACQAFTPWHDKTTGETGTAGKCLHY